MPILRAQYPGGITVCLAPSSGDSSATGGQLLGWGVGGADPEAGGEGRSQEGELSASCFSYLVPGVSVPPSSSIPL